MSKSVTAVFNYNSGVVLRTETLEVGQDFYNLETDCVVFGQEFGETVAAFAATRSRAVFDVVFEAQDTAVIREVGGEDTSQDFSEWVECHNEFVDSLLMERREVK